MAKPIGATPTLRGGDAINFVKNMIKESKYPSKARVDTINKALEEFKYFRQYL
ncbi:MAG: hypothetical protein Q7S22_07745 [Candidatus Micrarchaeota archaeon]|nr:hypothetical protein [Candidatus Micrarchaeota archaeon]